MNRVGLITGASRGLGVELAGFLAKRSYDLVLTARGNEGLEATARALEKFGGGILAVAGDVSDTDHRIRLAESAESLGGLDLLVNIDSGVEKQPGAMERVMQTLGLKQPTGV